LRSLVSRLYDAPHPEPTMHHYFSFRLFRGARLVRVGKGASAKRRQATVRSYLRKRYKATRWDHYRLAWHRTESAAFKAVARLTDGYRRMKGMLPPRNRRRGGRGGGVTARWPPCPNAAIAGNYGFCRVHR
jgi:hypothetical protein